MTTAVIDPRLHPRHIIFSATIDLPDPPGWKSRLTELSCTITLHPFKIKSVQRRCMYALRTTSVGPCFPDDATRAALLRTMMYVKQCHLIKFVRSLFERVAIFCFGAPTLELEWSDPLRTALGWTSSSVTQEQPFRRTSRQTQHSHGRRANPSGPRHPFPSSQSPHCILTHVRHTCRDMSVGCLPLLANPCSHESSRGSCSDCLLGCGAVPSSIEIPMFRENPLPLLP